MGAGGVLMTGSCVCVYGETSRTIGQFCSSFLVTRYVFTRRSLRTCSPARRTPSTRQRATSGMLVAACFTIVPLAGGCSRSAVLRMSGGAGAAPALRLWTSAS